MPKHSYDVAVLEPQCLLNLTPRFRELGISPEEANQRDVDESRTLMVRSYEEAFTKASQKHGILAHLEFHQFVPDEIAESGRGGAVSVTFDFVRVVVESGVPVDIVVNLISDFLSEAAKTLPSVVRGPDPDSKRSLRRFTAICVEKMCIQHAQRMNKGHQVHDSQILKNPSQTSISNNVYVVTVGLGVKEITYIVGNDGEPQSIVETTQSKIRLLSTDEWREWFLATDA